MPLLELDTQPGLVLFVKVCPWLVLFFIYEDNGISTRCLWFLAEVNGEGKNRFLSVLSLSLQIFARVKKS
jgi:hypothetical protein